MKAAVPNLRPSCLAVHVPVLSRQLALCELADMQESPVVARQWSSLKFTALHFCLSAPRHFPIDRLSI